MKRIVLIALPALLAAGLGLFLFAWPVDEGAFKSEGWRTDTDAALAAAKAAGRPLFVKLGQHG